MPHSMEMKYSKYLEHEPGVSSALMRGCTARACANGTHAFRVDIMTIDPIVLSCQVVVVKSGRIHSTSVLSTT